MFGRGQKNECKWVRERCSPFLDGCLDHVEEDAVRYHVERCEQCRCELESLDATRELLQWMPSENVRRNFALPEVWRGWVRDPLSVRSINGLRVATAAVMIAFVVLLVADFSGAFYVQVEPRVTSQSSTAPSEQAVSSEQTSQDKEASEATSDSSGFNEARQPDASDYQGSGGIAGLPEETATDVEGDTSSPIIVAPWPFTPQYCPLLSVSLRRSRQAHRYAAPRITSTAKAAISLGCNHE